MRDCYAELLDVIDALSQQTLYRVATFMSEYMHSGKKKIHSQNLLSIPVSLDFWAVQVLMPKEEFASHSRNNRSSELK